MASMAHDSVDLAPVLRELKPGFESGALKPFPVKPEHVHSLATATDAFRKVGLGGTRDRVIIDPRKH